jgi:hypothetical protein
MQGIAERLHSGSAALRPLTEVTSQGYEAREQEITRLEQQLREAQQKATRFRVKVCTHT